MIDLKFSYNWNKKLDCHAFTTIRLFNPNKHFVGQLVKLFIKDKHIGEGAIADVSVFQLNSLNSFMAYLDTGYSAQEAVAIIKKMYPKVDFNNTRLVMLLIVKDEKKDIPQQELFNETIKNYPNANA